MRPPINPPIGIFKQNQIISISSNFIKLVTWSDPTNQPTHQTIRPPVDGEFCTDFKSSNRTEISWLVQVLPNFYWFQESPGGGRWLDGDEGGYGCVRGDVPCMHTCTFTHTHACTCMLNIINMLNMDASMSVAICNFYTCAYMHMHACGDTPMPADAPRHLPPPQSCREPKIQKFNKSWTNWDNSILFEDSLPLNIPELI